MNLKLVRYSEITETEYVAYIAEWENDVKPINPVASDRKSRSFSEMFEKWKYDETNETLKNGFVPSTLYFLVDDNSKIYGAIHHRHFLNDNLKLHGGNIGYGVRPSERQKGYGTLMLRLLLKSLERTENKEFMITCDDNNFASRKIIEKNGGILDTKIEFQGIVTRKYWINI